jgi:cell division protein FtsQ
MGTKRRNKKSSLAEEIFPFLIIGIFFAFVVVISGKGVIRYLKTSRYFAIRSVYHDPALDFMKDYRLDRLIGENIFSVDVNGIQRELQSRYPQIKNLQITRKFPDQISVTALQRELFACVRVKNRYALLDDKGVVIVLSNNISSADKYPLITGISFNESGIILGGAIRDKSLTVALAVIRSFKKNNALASLQLTELNMTKMSHIELSLSNQLKVLLDQERFDQKMRMLALVLSQSDLNPAEVEYIDLRFKEPVLKKK